MEDILLRTQNLSKTFSQGGQMQHVLRDVNLEIRRGSFTVIMGASGAGKSTLLYALSGMDKPSLGTIWFGEEDLTALTTDQMAVFRRRHCGFVFQQIQLLQSMNTLDNILCAGLLVSSNREAVAARIRELFRDVALPDSTFAKFPAQLSGGEAQRVGIVRALINNPEILFADEPTGALNSQTSTDVLDTLTHFHRQGQTIIMVTHDVHSARRGSRVLYLKDGGILGECDIGAYRHADRRRHERLIAFLTEMGW
ncbi:MAG: ABC transporter ATP-binding protein [Clostridia bacterium]|nr:ABC transporter ATP-binding protein [Clostridia bacterium]